MPATTNGWPTRNNASLGLVAAYNSLVPEFRRIYERDGGDFDRFYAEVRRLAALPESARLTSLASP